MRPKKDGSYVNGPYSENNGKRWRLYVSEDGVVSKPSFGSEKEAQREKERLEKSFAPRETLTIGNVVEQYVFYLRDVKRLRPWSWQNKLLRLRVFFADSMELSAPRLTPPRAEAMYHAHLQRPNRRTGKPLSDATTQGDLKKARELFKWAVKRGLLQTNPFVDVELVGKPKRGKPQLTADEGERWLKAAVDSFVEEGRPMALAAAICLTAGGRCGEVIQRVVGDLDDGGTALIVRERDAEHTGATVKNDPSKRKLSIHPALVPLVKMLAAGRPADALLFVDVNTYKWARQKMRYEVRRICQAAGVPMVTTHSLRGWYATAVYSESLSPSATARALGHSNFKMTKQCYLDPHAAERAQVARVGERLGLRDPQRRAQQLLQELDEDTLRALLQHAPQKLPGLVLGHQAAIDPTLLSAGSDPTADLLPSEVFPNLSHAPDPLLISDGER